MLPKENRLKKEGDFRRLRRRGRIYPSASFNLWIASATAPASPPRLRVGIVVSSRLDKRAVVRNRLKRLLRAVVRKKLPQLRPGFDLAFYVRPAMKGKTYAQVSAELDQTLPKTPLPLR